MAYLQKSASFKEFAQNTKDRKEELEKGKEELEKGKEEFEEKIFHQFVRKVKRIPYFRLDANVSLKRKMNLLEDSITVDAKAGANLSIEIKKGKIFVENAFAGLRGVCDKNDRHEDIVVNGRKRKKLAKVECILEKVNDENSWGVHKSIRVEIDGKKIVDNKENFIVGSRKNESSDSVKTIGDPDEIELFDILKAKTTKGYDEKEFQEARKFYKENRESILNGFKRVTTKEMKKAHKNTGEALREYLEMPLTID